MKNELMNLFKKKKAIDLKISNLKNKLVGAKAEVFYKDDYTIGTIRDVDFDKDIAYVVLDEIVDWDDDYIMEYSNGHPVGYYRLNQLKEIIPKEQELATGKLDKK